MEINYTLVYDASKVWPNNAIISLHLFVLALTIFFIACCIFMKSKCKKIVVCISAFFGILIGSCGAVNIDRKFWECRQITKNKDYEVIEGVVKDFHPMPYTGHDSERFVVNGVNFAYSDFNFLKGGFNNASSHGGPIREDLQVKIAHKNGRIMILWIRA